MCGSTAEVDDCGVCGGSGIPDGACDCDGNVLDCAGDCGGSAVEDDCGVCGGSGAEFECEDGSLVCNEDDCSGGGISDGCDLPSNNLYLMGNDVLYNSSVDIGGFQFGVEGADILGASGGAAATSGFTVSTSFSTVIGFSFSGDVIPAGCGLLTTFSLDGEGSSLIDIIISDPVGNPVIFEYFDDTYVDCPSGTYDCLGVCDGNAIEDDCGECNGLNECVGCTDDNALNFDSEASIDDGSCEYFNYSNLIVVTEIHYNPSLAEQGSDAEYEFIELYNNSDENINLANWSLQTTNTNFTFSENSNIPAQSYMILTRDTGVYWYLVDNVVAWGSERLENNNDFIFLYDNANQLVDAVVFTDSNPWPSAADAGGPSLELVNVNLDNSLAVSWQASVNVGGSPGEMNFVPIYGCTDESACNYNINANFDDETCEYAEDNFDCDGNCLIDVDCLGVCGGDAVVDECDVCDGDGTNCVEGCIDSTATNYNTEATIDDGTCFYAGENYPFWDTDFDSVLDNNPDYEFSLSVTGLVFNSNESIVAENDMLAAFVGDDLRGVSQALLVPTDLGHALSFLMLIYSNVEQGEEVNFKYYSFESDQVYALNESIDFEPDLIIGDVNNPYIFTYGDYDYHYNTNLENTGNSALFIFNENLNLDYGDEIGIFDLNGIPEINFDCSDVSGETLVGSGLWTNSQLEIVAVGSVDLCDFGGYQLGGYQDNNEVIIKVWSASDQMEYYGVANYSIGNNVWGQPLYVVDEIELVEESEFFVAIDPLSLNLVSLNVATLNQNIEHMFGSDILLIFDDNSNFYIPDYDINQIQTYDFSEGYMMFADHAIEMNMSGQIIDHTHPILLEPYKANMIPYFHEECLPVEYAFTNIEEDLLLVKNDEGLYYIPNQNINTLEALCPGHAYIAFLSSEESVEFQYPAMIAGKIIASNSTKGYSNELLSCHSIYKTGISQPVIVQSITGDYEIGNEIVVYADNRPVGAAIIDGNFPIVISAWESFNVEGYSLPGFANGESVQLKLYNRHLNIYVDLQTQFNSSVFGESLMIIGDVISNFDSNHIVAFNLNNIYPNPFNPITTISLDVFQADQYSIFIYDMLGKIVFENIVEYDSPGIYNVTFDGSSLSSGTYIVRIISDTQQASQKITLLK